VWRVPDPRIQGQPPTIGFVADLAFITEPLKRIMAEPALLPPTLGNDAASVVGVRVLNRDGGQIYASTSDWSPYASESALDAEFGSLRLGVALNPKAAESLIIGGLPRSRLPLLVGLITLTSGLVLIAIVQLRREQEFARLRADFISGVSHELRTPLAQIRMFGETLLLGRVRSRDEHQRSLAIIVQESQRLSHLIENVLQFSRAERGTPSVSLTPMRLDTLLDDIVDSFTPLANAKRASITRRIEDGLTVPVDPGAFRQIILNLLDNAVKYGPVGQAITVTAQREHDWARITVEDEGPGVATDQVARIWQPFYRVSTDGTATGGTGIGLAIVKQLIDLHQGRVSVERRESGGARFVVELCGASSAQGACEWPAAAARSVR
jgi:signal transduction histidine kinase